MGAEAFILSGATHAEALLSMFNRRQVPFAFTSVWQPDLNVPIIGYDNRHLAREAVQYLGSLGHDRIAVLHGPLENDRTKARRNGAELGADKSQKLEFHRTELSVAGGRQAIRDIMKQNNRPTAVLCFSDVLALGVLFGLSEAGLSVPDDVSVMGFDNLDWAMETHPPLTTINLPSGQMGAAVATQIMNHLELGTPLGSEFLAAEIIKRASVKDLR